MNERIKQLANEVQFTSDVTYTELEKFAESIVKECAEVSENYAAGSMPLSIAHAIKKHFGVK
jgi:hypothetical protein